MSDLTSFAGLRRRNARFLRTTGLSCVVAIAGLLSACTSLDPPLPPEPERLKMPASLMDAIAFVESQPVCEAGQDHAIVPRGEVNPAKPVLLERCIPNYHQVLEDNGYIAACLGLFDIGEDGAPIGIRVKCNTENDFGRTDEAEAEIAHAMFLRTGFLAIGKMRFNPLEQAADTEKRADIAQPFRFTFEPTSNWPPYPPAQNPEDGGKS